eukprot:TRINITY_DN9505_c0_g1_i3.p1 TRINITY_DN9505_c0_g1~~TRINITY_DN9505_c0_g1_i3.p1  ORF type:complete len:284 (-),score=47.04 TRINITY_DN9505_c0_g1_i3:220-1071(-)
MANIALAPNFLASSASLHGRSTQVSSPLQRVGGENLSLRWVDGRDGRGCQTWRRMGPVAKPTSLLLVRAMSSSEDFWATSPATATPATPVASVGVLPQTPPSIPVEAVQTLKQAAKTWKVAPEQVADAIDKIEKAKIDPKEFLPAICGDASPGRTWMLIFSRSGKKDSGHYFPITAVQRFDAKAMEIENGVFVGPLGELTFKGPFSWKGRQMSFIFTTLSLKLGPLGPFVFKIGKDGEDEKSPGDPKAKDPFFLWWYADEEIIVARGRSGGVALWSRCKRVRA